jgi:homocysteine S-methyltransferase
VPAARLRSDLAVLAAVAPGAPLAAYGNLGLPADDLGWAFTEGLSPESYAEQARHWLELGASLIGGCCGTRPQHTAALRDLLDSLEPWRPTGTPGT